MRQRFHRWYRRLVTTLPPMSRETLLSIVHKRLTSTDDHKCSALCRWWEDKDDAPHLLVCEESQRWHVCGARCKELIETEHQEYDICPLTGRTALANWPLGGGINGYDDGVVERGRAGGAAFGGDDDEATGGGDDYHDTGAAAMPMDIEPIVDFYDAIDVRETKSASAAVVSHDAFLRKRALQQHARKKSKRDRQTMLMTDGGNNIGAAVRATPPSVVAAAAPGKRRKRYKISPTLTANGVYADRSTCERLVALMFASSMAEKDRSDLSALLLRTWTVVQHTETYRENKAKYSLPLFAVLFVQESRQGVSDETVQYIPYLPCVAKAWPGLHDALQRIAPEARVLSKAATKFDWEFKVAIKQAHAVTSHSDGA